MATGAPWQILCDCPHCHTEASVVEVMDPHHPACHLGHPIERRCRLCAWLMRAESEPFGARHPMSMGRCPACTKALGEAARSGEAPCPHCGYSPTLNEVHLPSDLTDATAALAALTRWATEEGEPDVESFCTANMGAPSAQVVAWLGAGEVVPTTFDVIAFLFPGGGGGGGASPVASATPTDRRRDSEPSSPGVAPTPEPMDPRTPARVLVSVMVADGALRAGEHTFVLRWLEREGLPAMESSDLRVWRPTELGTPPEPELRDRVLEAAVHLMHLDRQRDGSEWRVVEAFARAWGVDPHTLRAWDRRYDKRYRSPMRSLMAVLDRLTP